MHVAIADPKLRSILAIRLSFIGEEGGPGGAESWAPDEGTTLEDVVEVFWLLSQTYARSGGAVEGQKLGELPEPARLPRDQQLRIHRLSMESPLEFLASIPPSFLAGAGGLFTFLASFERVFNLPLAVRVSRERLLAEGEAHKADRVQDELRLARNKEALDVLRTRADSLRLPPASAALVELEESGASSVGQSRQALTRANEVRTARTQLKKNLKSGHASIESVLLDPPEYLMTARVFDLLLAVPKLGRVKTNGILNQCRISPSKTVGGLSERQRLELVEVLRG
jgi:hypothetical protein